MGYFDNVYSGTINKLGQAKSLSEDVIKGNYAGALREGNGAIDLSASQGGWLKSPVAAALKRKEAARLTAAQGQDLTGLNANYLNQLGTLEGQQAMATAQENRDSDLATQNMWGNVIGTAGNLLGTAQKIFKWGV